MKKKYDTSLFKNSISVGDPRNVEFKFIKDHGDEDYDDNDNGGSLRVINKDTGILNYNINKDIDGNMYYIPSGLNNISEYEAKVRLLNNEIDNYESAKNSGIINNMIYTNKFNKYRTNAMIYKNKKIGIAKREETINDMQVKPEDYVFVAKVSKENNTGFLGEDGIFIENWGAPIDTSMVKYYNDLEECVADAVMFNYKNSVSTFSPNNKPFIAIPKNTLVK